MWCTDRRIHGLLVASMSRQQKKGASRPSSSGSRSGGQRPATAGEREQGSPDHDEEDQGRQRQSLLMDEGGGRGRRSSFQDRLSSSSSRGGVQSKVYLHGMQDKYLAKGFVCVCAGCCV